jgi:pimeloyl-ACP methyl ester carboxylesterase
MATNTRTSNASDATREHYTTGFVTAKDGVTLGYRQLGHGPGIVMLHGAMESSQSHMQLAQALADAFTVYLPDRRGRGLSGPHGENYSLQEDIDDMAVILKATGARYMFGVSSGGDICLQSALTLPDIDKVAVYEPALMPTNKTPNAVLARYDREMAQGKLAAALVTGMKGGKMGPPIFNIMPRWLLVSMTNSFMKKEDKQPKQGAISMRTLAPTLHYDFSVVAALSGKQRRFKEIRANVLLLGGSKSPTYLKAALGQLAEILPHARRVEFPGLDHGGSSDVSEMNRSGDPERVAQELRRFFAAG